MRGAVPGWSKRSKWVLGVTLALAIPNFLACAYLSTRLGGDALSGYVQAGHYFLCSSKGRCFEVAQSVWDYSFWHELYAFAGLAVAGIEFAILVIIGDIVLNDGKRA